MSESNARWLAEYSAYSIAIPILIALVFVLRLNKEQKLLFGLLVISLGTELLSRAIGIVAELNNLFLLHIYTVLEFTVIALIYRHKLPPAISKKWMNALIVCFALLALINTFFFEKITEFNTHARALAGLLIILFTVLYFYKILIDMKIKRLEKEPMFWLNMGLLLYFSASLFIFVFSNYIEPSVKLSFTFWGIHAILIIIKNLFFAITLWIKPPKPM